MANRSRTGAIEWPTLLVGVLCVGAWFALVLLHDHLPTIVTIVLLGIDGAWFMSFQHELTHGHPTRHQWINTALGWAPFALWLPYVRYRTIHTEHHRSDLTVPGVDPESFYVTRAQWDNAGPVMRRFLAAMRYLPFRMAFGPGWSMLQSFHDEFREIGRECRRTFGRDGGGDWSVARVWVWQIAGATGVVVFLISVAHMPMWQYLLGYSYLGMSLSMIRSFAEHRAVDGETRSATVRSGPFFSMLFLNNNLHHTHHSHPGVPWYELPALADSMGASDISARGAGLYHGYREIARRYSFSPFCQEIHPHDKTLS